MSDPGFADSRVAADYVTFISDAHQPRSGTTPGFGSAVYVYPTTYWLRRRELDYSATPVRASFAVN